MILRTISISLVALGAAAVCSPASSAGFWHMFAHSNAPALPARTLIVSFADLNVGEEPGAKALIGRIKAAAQKVCGPRPSSPLLNREMISYKTCVRDAMERGIASANQPLVVQLYHSGGHGMTGSTTTTKK